MLWHDDFFTNRKGETYPYWKITNVRDRFIIQHPYIQFGFWTVPWTWKERKRKNTIAEENKTPVYFQKFELPKHGEIFDIPEFMSKVKKNAHLKSDETLWYETGFWSIMLDGANCMGMGVEQLTKVVSENKDAKSALCFSNNLSLLILASEGVEQRVTVSVYCSNELIPFVEVIEPYRKAVAEYEGS